MDMDLLPTVVKYQDKIETLNETRQQAFLRKVLPRKKHFSISYISSGKSKTKKKGSRKEQL